MALVCAFSVAVFSMGAAHGEIISGQVINNFSIVSEAVSVLHMGYLNHILVLKSVAKYKIINWIRFLY